MTTSPPRPRRRKPLDAGPFAPEISSFRLHLAAEGNAPRTVRTYAEAVAWFAAAHLTPPAGHARWEQVSSHDVQRWMVHLLTRYSDAYASNEFRALQQFFRWRDLDLWRREITVRGKGGRARVVRISHDAARALDRYIRVRSRHDQAWRPQLWLGVNNRGPLTANGIYQMIARRGRQAGVDAWTHRFRHHFSHTWLDRGGAEGDLMELNGWSSPQMLRRYGASARGARARRTYDRIMTDRP
jgi:site-specific recombinase XerD